MRLREVGSPQDEALVHETLKRAVPFKSRLDLKPLVEKLGASRIVMLGEASHGTHEFYHWRKIISQELILNHGFQFIAVEGDWPPSSKLNDFVHGSGGASAREALRAFTRWPTWMWANAEILELAEWMRSHNAKVATEKKVGFYGLDVYSLFESIDVALEQLSRISPLMARRLKTRFDCFEPFHRNEKAYARSLLQFPAGCLEEVVKNQRDLLEFRLEEGGRSSFSPFQDPLFDAKQNIRIVTNAENYYRTMVHGNEDSWNVRDRHMLETLQILLDRYGPQSKALVWAHNTHIGDYRATDMAAQGQINLGGLAREYWGEDHVSLVGFGAFEGEVIASHAWDGPIERMPVPPAKAGSFEAAFHKVSEGLRTDTFYLSLLGDAARKSALAEVRGHRAIGVVYQPAYEQLGNYVPTSLAHRYDAFLFFDSTTALNPLRQGFDRNEMPETWPQGM